MKKKYVLWGAGMAIISIIAISSFQIARLSKTENIDLWNRTRVVKQKSEVVANNTKSEFFRQTVQEDMEDILHKETRIHVRKEEHIKLLSYASEEKEAATYLLSQRIKKHQLENMQKLGYSSREMAAIWKVCNSPEERSFLLHMMEGTKESYGQAFQIDPDKLSDSLTVFMGEYSMRLVQIIDNETFIQETKEQFEHFNNAILASEKTYEPKKKEVSLSGRNLLFRDIYLQRMYISSILEMERNVMELSCMDQEAVNYVKHYETYMKDRYVLNLWGSEVQLIEKLGNAGTEEAFQLSIHELKYKKNNGFSFSIRHYSPYKEAFVEEKISNTMLWGPGDIDDTW